MNFTELEAKLVRLALDVAAEPGEIEQASHRLIMSLRNRGVRPEALLYRSEQTGMDFQLQGRAITYDGLCRHR